MSAPTRTNPHTGRPCPDWCQIDHAEPAQTSCVGSGSSGLRLPQSTIWARAMITPKGPRVTVHGMDWATPDRDVYVAVDPRHAGDLAVLLELLAGATPEQHRMLAAGIRQAAADLNGPPEQPEADDRGQLIGDALRDLADDA